MPYSKVGSLFNIILCVRSAPRAPAYSYECAIRARHSLAQGRPAPPCRRCVWPEQRSLSGILLKYQPGDSAMGVRGAAARRGSGESLSATSSIIATVASSMHNMYLQYIY